MFTRYLLPAAAVLALTFAAFQLVKAQQKPEVAAAVEPGKSPYTRQVAGAGIVEPETENIAIGSFTPGVVTQVRVRVGDRVAPAAPLFHLDDRSLRAELRVREKLLASAEASSAKLNNSPRKDERPAQEARVREAEVALDDLRQSLARMEDVAAGARSADEYAKRKWAAKSGEATVARAKADFELWKLGAWDADRLIGTASVAQAAAQKEQTEVELSRLTVPAPHLGWKRDDGGRLVPDDAGVLYDVLQVNVRAGEYVNAAAGTPLVVLGKVGRLHVRVDLDENDIARFRPDLSGVAIPRGNPQASFPLAFVRVEPYVIPKKSLTGANTERVDTRVLQVIYSIDTGGKPLYVGQQMDVFLNAGR